MSEVPNKNERASPTCFSSIVTTKIGNLISAIGGGDGDLAKSLKAIMNDCVRLGNSKVDLQEQLRSKDELTKKLFSDIEVLKDEHSKEVSLRDSEIKRLQLLLECKDNELKQIKRDRENEQLTFKTKMKRYERQLREIRESKSSEEDEWKRECREFMAECREQMSETARVREKTESFVDETEPSVCLLNRQMRRGLTVKQVSDEEMARRLDYYREQKSQGTFKKENVRRDLGITYNQLRADMMKLGEWQGR